MTYFNAFGVTGSTSLVQFSLIQYSVVTCGEYELSTSVVAPKSKLKTNKLLNATTVHR